MSSNNAAQYVPILDRSNYGLWSQAIKAFLMSLGLWAFANSTNNMPNEVVDANGAVTNQAVIDEWAQKDDMAIGHITLHVNASIQQELTSLQDPDSLDVWDH